MTQAAAEEIIRLAPRVETDSPEGAAGREAFAHALMRAAFAMSEFAKDADPDDYAEEWARGVMGRGPIYLVAALMPDQTLTWLMERREEAFVLATDVHHVTEGERTRHFGRATLENKTYLLRHIEALVRELVKDKTGAFLEDRQGAGA